MKLSRNFISANTAMCNLTEWVASPYLRKTVTTDKTPIKAELSVCGLGFYRFWLDGEELTRGHMSPYISNPDDVMDYDVYDITDKFASGKHVLGFQLGNGMQNCFGGYVWDFEKAAWRSAPKLAICLVLTYEKEMNRGVKLSGVKKIRIHDLRHSHVSLLIELGFSAKEIAERLGHENIETTLNTYSHLYPNKQEKMANRLDAFYQESLEERKINNGTL